MTTASVVHIAELKLGKWCPYQHRIVSSVQKSANVRAWGQGVTTKTTTLSSGLSYPEVDTAATLHNHGITMADPLHQSIIALVTNLNNQSGSSKTAARHLAAISAAQRLESRVSTCFT